MSCSDARVAQRQMLLRLAVHLRGRLLREFRDVVGPARLGWRAELCDRLDAVTDLGARVLRHGAFHHAFVVIDEEPRRRRRVLLLLLPLVQLEDRADRVGRARAELPLVVDRRHLRAQAHACGQRLGGRDGEQVVAHVRCVRAPAVALLLTDGEPSWCGAHVRFPPAVAAGKSRKDLPAAAAEASALLFDVLHHPRGHRPRSQRRAGVNPERGPVAAARCRRARAVRDT